ncbi:hypothetical protein TEQG_08589, partial [Trichophyton equinum CBS 127.97]
MTQEIERTPGSGQSKTVRVSFEATADPQASNLSIQPSTSSSGGHHRSATSGAVQFPSSSRSIDDAGHDSHSSANESRPRSRPNINGNRRKPALIRAKSEHWHDLGPDVRALGGEEEM